MNNIKEILATTSSIIISLGVIVGAIWKPTKKRLKTMLEDANEPLRKQIDIISADLTNMQKQQLIYEKDTLRRYILVFSSEVRNSIPKTQKQYEEFFKTTDKYENILIKLHETNGYINSEVDYVRSVMNNLERR